MQSKSRPKNVPNFLGTEHLDSFFLKESVTPLSTHVGAKQYIYAVFGHNNDASRVDSDIFIFVSVRYRVWLSLSHGPESVAKSEMVEKYTEHRPFRRIIPKWYYIVFSIELHVLVHISGAGCVLKQWQGRLMREVCTSGITLRSLEGFHHVPCGRVGFKVSDVRWNRRRD